jgi:hypothetical protein
MAFFLAGSVLLMLGFIVIAVGIVVINHIFAIYWKPIQMYQHIPVYYEEDPPRNQKVETKK